MRATIDEVFRALARSEASAASTISDPYSQTVAVFQCCSVISRSIAAMPLALYRGEERIETHPLLTRLAQPNQLMNTGKWVRTTVTQMLLRGSSFTVLDLPDSTGVPRAMFPFPGGTLSPDRPPGNLYDLKGWTYQAHGRQVTLPPDRVVRFEYAPSPDDPLVGIGPLAVARLTVDTDYSQTVYNRSVLRNNGTPAGVLRWKGPNRLDDQDIEYIRTNWRETYGGAQNAESTAVLGADFEYQSIGINPKDMQFMQARHWNLKEIARAFGGVPLIFLGEHSGTGLSGAEVKVYKRMLYDEIALPLARDMAQVMTALYVSPVDPSLMLVFDTTQVEALRGDLTEKLTQGKALRELGYSRNQINVALELGMPDDDGERGDVVLVAAGMATVESVIEGSLLPAIDVTPTDSGPPQISGPNATTASVLPTDTVIDIVAKVAAGTIPRDSALAIMQSLLGLTAEQAAAMLGSAGIGDGKNQAIQGQAQLPAPIVRKLTPKRLALWRTYTRAAQPLENKLQAKIRKELMRQRSLVLRALDANGRGLQRAPTKRNIEDAVEAVDAEALAATIKPGIIEAYELGGGAVLQESADLAIIDNTAVKLKKKLLPELASEFYDAQLGHVVAIGSTVKKAVNTQLLEGYSNGEDLSDLKDRVRRVFNAGTSRARTIARTEIGIAQNTGRFETMQAQGIEKHEWLSAGDEHVREDHQIDGEVVAMGDEFSNGLKYPNQSGAPAELVINCRCVALPVPPE